MFRLVMSAVVWFCVVAPALQAHPVPSFTYDRTIRVRLTPQGVRVAYQLELTDFTVLRDIDKLPGVDDAKLGAVRSGATLRDLFAVSIAPLLADRLEAWQGERALAFKVIANDPSAKAWAPIEDHLRFEFTLFAPWVAPLDGPFPFRLNLFKPTTQEEFHLENGRIDLGFDANQDLTLNDRHEPAAELKDRAAIDRTAREEVRLRELAAIVSPGSIKPRNHSKGPLPPAPPDSSTVTQLRKRGLVILLESDLGIGLLLVLATVFGAAHALTPGHGKTLVAAYLVGQRGTVGHAFLLGLVTTLTHTGIVIILAAVLPLLAQGDQQRVQGMLGFGGGLLIAGLGIWLLLRRLAGGADHVHIGGGHHHHGPGGHLHHHLPAGDRVRIWDLLVLGVSGGIVPCWDAIVLLAMAIGTQRIWLGLPLLLAFSAGLAGVLVLIGVLVVKVKGFGSSRLGEGRLVKSLPILSAIAVTILGVWLCVDSAISN